MLDLNFTLEDIKEFLEKELKQRWLFEVYSYEERLFRKATMKDFIKNMPKKIPVLKIRDGEQNLDDNQSYSTIDIEVTNDIFNVLYWDDYSPSWQKFLDKKWNKAYEYSNC